MSVELFPSKLKVADKDGVITPEFYRGLRTLTQNSTINPYSVTVPVSGSLFSANKKMSLVVSGGTVSLLRFKRNTVYVTLPIVSGILELSPGDSVEFTYVVAPTLTAIPR